MFRRSIGVALNRNFLFLTCLLAVVYARWSEKNGDLWIIGWRLGGSFRIMPGLLVSRGDVFIPVSVG